MYQLVGVAMTRRGQAVTALVVIAAGALAGLLVLLNQNSESEVSKRIDNIQGGAVADLVMVDDSYDRWFVTQVDHMERTADDNVVSIIYYTSRCARQGIVGYKTVETSQVVRLTIVAGENGNCYDIAVPHATMVSLRSPLGDRRLVALRPDYGIR